MDDKHRAVWHFKTAHLELNAQIGKTERSEPVRSWIFAAPARGAELLVQS